MLFKLIYFEIKQWLKSKLFFCYIIISVFSIIINMNPMNSLSEPDKNHPTVGQWENENTQDKIDQCIGRLIIEYHNNHFIVYKYGLSYEKELVQEQLSKIDNIFFQITGMRMRDVDIYIGSVTEDTEALLVYKTIVGYNNIHVDMDYLSFCKAMDSVDEIIGGGSAYCEESRNAILTFGDYEEELKEYNSIIKEDKISNAYARLFCDFAVIDLSLIPIFLSVSRSLKDKNGYFENIVFIKRIKSRDIIFSRFIAIILLELVSVVLMSIPYQINVIRMGVALNVSIDYFAFLKTIILWLLPSILIVNSIGFVVTEITQSRIAILLQMVWWFFDLNIGSDKMIGKFSLHLMPRFNIVGRRDIYELYYNELLINRIVYSLVAFLLIFITVQVYEKRRTGCWKIGQSFKLLKRI